MRQISWASGRRDLPSPHHDQYIGLVIGAVTDGQHLLFAARQLLTAMANAPSGVERSPGPGRRSVALPRVPARADIFRFSLDAQVAKDTHPSGCHAMPLLGNLVKAPGPSCCHRRYRPAATWVLEPLRLLSSNTLAHAIYVPSGRWFHMGDFEIDATQNVAGP